MASTGCYTLQYYTVPYATRPSVHRGRISTVNTVLPGCTTMIIQKMTAKKLAGVTTHVPIEMDKVETARILKPIKFTEELIYNFELITLARTSTQMLTHQSAFSASPNSPMSVSTMVYSIQYSNSRPPTRWRSWRKVKMVVGYDQTT